MLFLDDGRIEMDTNSVERAMRPIALNRKNSLFAGHDEGAVNWACLASLIETAKIHGIDPQAYLADVLAKLVNGWPVQKLDELLPWAWAKQQVALQDPGCMKQPAYSYDELDDIFRGNGRSGNIGISAIDGVIAALVAGPAFVSPDEWLPIIFAGRMPAVIEGTPEHLAVNTIFNRYNEVSITLVDNPQAYRPMFMNHEGGVIVNDWAAGFMLAVGKSTDAWTKILLTDMRKVLAPIFVSHDLGTRILPDLSKAEMDKLRAVAHHQIADAVISLHSKLVPHNALQLHKIPLGRANHVVPKGPTPAVELM